MRRVELGVREKQRNLVGAALPPNGERPALTATAVVGLDDLHSWKVSILAQTGLSFDLSAASGKLMRTIMAVLAEFQRDLIRDRVKSGLAAARTRGVKLGRQVGQRPSDKKAKRVLGRHDEHPVGRFVFVRGRWPPGIQQERRLALASAGPDPVHWVALGGSDMCARPLRSFSVAT
jgi:Resolvase, N terminal domain